MGPDNLCYVTGHFFLFCLCHHVTSYKTLTSLSSFYKRPRRISTTFKVAVSHFVFYPRGALKLMNINIAKTKQNNKQIKVNKINVAS